MQYQYNRVQSNWFMLKVLLKAKCNSMSAVIPPFQYLFKNDHRSFSDMQFQLYSFTAVAAGLLWGMEAQATTQEEYEPGKSVVIDLSHFWSGKKSGVKWRFLIFNVAFYIYRGQLLI